MTTPEAPPAQVASDTEDAVATLSIARDYSVASAEDEQFAAEMIAEVKAKYDQLEQMKQEALRPMREAVARIQGWFKPAQTALAETEQALKQAVLAFRGRLEAERKRALLALAESKTLEEVRTQTAAIAATQPTNTPGLSSRKIWSFDIVDPNLVPDEYWMLNMQGIGVAVQNGKREIPGIKIFQREILASTRKK